MFILILFYFSGCESQNLHVYNKIITKILGFITCLIIKD